MAASGGQQLDLTTSWAGYVSLLVFIVAYALVMAEEFTHMRKSKPVMLAAGLIWGIIAYIYASHGFTHAADSEMERIQGMSFNIGAIDTTLGHLL